MKLFSIITLLACLVAPSNAQAVVSGTGCAGLAMNTSGSPALGQGFSYGVTGASPSIAGAMFIGLPGVPVDLTIIGATGCTLYLFSPSSFPVTMTAFGDHTTTLIVPNIPATVDASLGVQYAALVGPANPLGVGLSDTVTSTILP